MCTHFQPYLHRPMHSPACQLTQTPIRPHPIYTHQDYMILLLWSIIHLAIFTKPPPILIVRLEQYRIDNVNNEPRTLKFLLKTLKIIIYQVYFSHNLLAQVIVETIHPTHTSPPHCTTHTGLSLPFDWTSFEW